MLKTLQNKFKENWLEIVLVVAVLIIAGIAHGNNMFHYPYYEDDEGTYMSQAWSVLAQGKLAPYTYWYDHAPAGWLLITLWELLTGGFFTFGMSVDSGRVFMLVLHIVSVYFLYKIAKNVSGSKLAAIASALVFALSPLGLTFERRVLLDNIMTFWLLISFYIILNGKKLHHYLLSAVLFGISVLTKESAVFFLPVLLFTIYKKSHETHRTFAVLKWLTIVLAIISVYFLYALIKGEFFPSGTIFGGIAPHVSLMDSFHYQLSRTGGFFLNSNSGFMLNFREWIKGGFFIPVPDPVIIIGGIAATILMSIWSLKDKKLLFVSLPSLSYWLFLIRGGEVIGFYITPLIPFLALNIGVSAYKLANLVPKHILKSATKPLMMIIILSPFIWYYCTNFAVYQIDQTTAQIKALDWISKNISKNANLIIDNYAYIEFHDQNKENKYKLPKQANYYWKADTDPDVKSKILRGDWSNIDYIIATPQLEYDAVHADLPTVRTAFENSTTIKTFEGDKWNIQIRKVIKSPAWIMTETWSNYKQTFLSINGRVMDGAMGNTTSEGQSYSLLRAVWLQDKSTFDKVWGWTKQNTQRSDGVFAWKYGKDTLGNEKVLDSGTATDADTDIALSLLFAYKQWGDKTYLDDANTVLNGIWNTDVKHFKGKYYIIPGNWAKDKDYLIVNPSYLSPYAYRIFAEADPSHPWTQLVDSSYEVLNGCMSSNLGQNGNSVYLPPNWCEVDSDGNYVPPTESGLNSTEYSYDAVRTMWRLALDYKWFNDPRAKDLLEKSGAFLLKKWTTDGKILVGYSHSGEDWEKYESVLGYATSLANFSVTNPAVADQIYKSQVLAKFYEDFDKGQSYWEDPNNYYDQNWAWFGTALYSDNLPNLWNK